MERCLVHFMAHTYTAGFPVSVHREGMYTELQKATKKNQDVPPPVAPPRRCNSYFEPEASEKQLKQKEQFCHPFSPSG